MASIELKEAFIKELGKIYDANENLARYLFDRWNVETKVSLSDLVRFLNSDAVRKVFFVLPELNRAKNYSVKELEQRGIHLDEVIDSEKRVYRDKKYGFKWREKYHGMADCYTGLYELIEPVPQDEHLL